MKQPTSWQPVSRIKWRHYVIIGRSIMTLYLCTKTVTISWRGPPNPLEFPIRETNISLLLLKVPYCQHPTFSVYIIFPKHAKLPTKTSAGVTPEMNLRNLSWVKHALKPRADIIRYPKQGRHWPQQNDSCPPNDNTIFETRNSNLKSLIRIFVAYCRVDFQRLKNFWFGLCPIGHPRQTKPLHTCIKFNCSNNSLCLE